MECPNCKEDYLVKRYSDNWFCAKCNANYVLMNGHIVKVYNDEIQAEER